MLSFKSMKRKGSHSDHGNSRQPDGSAAHQPRSPGEASPKRLRLTKPREPRTPSYDVTRDVSDELLLRIFSYVDEQTLLAAAPVSRQFYRVASDPQLWRSHYYRRFILPRANRIPGLKVDDKASSQDQGESQASVGANDDNSSASAPPTPAEPAEPAEPFKPADPADKSKQPADHVDWKQQYRLRHNWARGLCEVRQVQVSPVNFALTPVLERRTLVKVVNGLAVTVDLQAGLRAWDLRTQLSIAQTTTETHDGIRLVPTALSLDGQRLSAGTLDIMLGFNDGTFGIWRLIMSEGKLVVLYRQDKSYVGRLTSVAYSYPYAITAAELGFISLYTFETPAPEPELASTSAAGAGPGSSSSTGAAERPRAEDGDEGYLNDDEMDTLLVGAEVDRSSELSQPHVLSSLKSDYSRQPLVLSLRKLKSSAVASIAYSFDTVGGWAIGIQNFDIRPSGSSKPDVITSRVAYTLPAETGGLVTSTPYRPKCPTCSNFPDLYADDDEGGPAKLCYSHPYLLATMQDNTLVLFVVTATEKSFAISNPMRLYGHTSGIADADITPEGRAVSVSERGDEIRVWDLEGRQDGDSIEVRPRPNRDFEDAADDEDDDSSDHEHRRNWVGTDDQRVTVLRETSDGRESLVTYDFT
ncbi:f-box domain-containing [Trichoderma arundinaceum]|uniref:F-box domain-containing n=1 Tax=Trichoderma arundinaceum TaxID=490622 RepID=A0A395NRE0_TRIAR|nr:f-box domain-containing [Trichoderma arundinaceum]